MYSFHPSCAVGSVTTGTHPKFTPILRQLATNNTNFIWISLGFWAASPGSVALLLKRGFSVRLLSLWGNTTSLIHFLAFCVQLTCWLFHKDHSSTPSITYNSPVIVFPLKIKHSPSRYQFIIVSYKHVEYFTIVCHPCARALLICVFLMYVLGLVEARPKLCSSDFTGKHNLKLYFVTVFISFIS